MGKAGLARIGLIAPACVTSGTKVRVPRAYPMYDSGYREGDETLRSSLPPFGNLKKGDRELGAFPYDTVLDRLKVELDALIEEKRPAAVT